ncbi:MAG: hypothetical protein ACTFAK_01680 [Candidatus Electronema sp. VV]
MKITEKFLIIGDEKIKLHHITSVHIIKDGKVIEIISQVFSEVYFSFFKRKNQTIILLYATIYTIIFVSDFIFPDYYFYLARASLMSIVFLIILTVKELLTKYRIRKGLFGTNRAEARELIDFIIKNSDNLDFTDSNGNLRRALLPEEKDAVEEHIPGTLGEEARA